jgi:hypothetical protein
VHFDELDRVVAHAGSLSRCPRRADPPDKPGVKPEDRADRFWTANRPHLSADIQAAALPAGLSFELGRDGCLTGRIDGDWLGGTSCPGAVGRAMTDDAVVPAGGLCLVTPTHAQQVRVMLDRLPAGAALLAVWADAGQAAMAMRCVDVADDLATGRLRVALLEELDRDILAAARLDRGWALPTTLFQCGDAAGGELRSAVEAVRHVLELATQARQSAVSALEVVRPDAAGPTLVVGSRRFTLWQDAASVLGDAMPGGRVFDTSDPRTASALAFHDVAQGTSGVVAADLLRTDLAQVMSPAMPWTTWISRPRPPHPPVTGDDRLILADGAWVDAWRRAGWRPETIRVGGWPRRVRSTSSAGPVVLAWDVQSREPPASVREYSSWATLWRAIQQELEQYPSRLTESPSATHWLRSRLADAGVEVPDDTLPAWIENCITPALARAAATALRNRGRKFVVVGQGWEPSCAEIRTAADLDALLRSASAVVDPAYDGTPALRGVGLPVLAAEDTWSTPVQAHGRTVVDQLGLHAGRTYEAAA